MAKAAGSKEFAYEKSNTLKGHKGAVMVVRFNKNGNYCLSGGKDRNIILWNPRTAARVQEYKGVHGQEVLDVSVSTDNSAFASCGGDRVVYIWDVPTAKSLRRFHGHRGRVNAVKFHENGSVLASGGYDATIRLWDCRARSRDPIQILDQFNDAVSSLVMSETEIAAASVDGCIRVFDIRAGRLATDTIAVPLTSVCMSHDGNCVLVSCMDSTVKLMDKANGGMLNEYQGHMHEKYMVESCLTNTDNHIISGSEDGKVYVWSMLDGKLVHTMSGHSRAVVSVDYHPVPEEHCLLTASVDGSVIVWR